MAQRGPEDQRGAHSHPASGVRRGDFLFRLAAFIRRALSGFGELLERSGERAIRLSLFRAGALLKQPLLDRARIHPRLRERTSGLALAALAHKLTPHLERWGVIRNLKRCEGWLARKFHAISQAPESAASVGIAVLLGVAIVASLLPGPAVDQRARALDEGIAIAVETETEHTPPALWGAGLDPDRVARLEAPLSLGTEQGSPVVDVAATSPLGWRSAEPARDASAELTSSLAISELDGPKILEDGTMRLPAAVQLSIPDGRVHVSIHVVKKGETLAQIAKLYSIGIMDVIWSNRLISTSNPPAGKRLKIPDVKGYVHVVAEHETMKSIASSAHIPQAKVVAYNELRSTDVVLGMVLVLPGGRGPALPTYAASGQAYAYNGPLPAIYSGMTFRYPVPGGRFVRGFFRGHDGMDIAQGVGAPILAAAAGVVVRTGWYDNCGGNQVVIAVGSNLYTGYYHMSKILVSPGQKIARGQQIGKIGDSGCTTGPHLHFSVSRGYPLSSGSTFYNPARFLP
jgi:murein DD-endopeptidase MepM/ murein hydrolase activator NlpD